MGTSKKRRVSFQSGTKNIPAPGTERELMKRADSLSGQTLGQLARGIDVRVPANQKHAKGWTGELLELALGATAATLPEPDFQYLGIELKSLPVNDNGRPRESTYMCTVPLTGITGLEWENSTLKRKLERVLWVPVEADPSITLCNRRIGKPFLWSPNSCEWSQLRTDWEEFMNFISLGELDKINARHGRVLQIRPKAASAGDRARSINMHGETGKTLPRGFYLRAGFTWEILKKHCY